MESTTIFLLAMAAAKALILPPSSNILATELHP